MRYIRRALEGPVTRAVRAFPALVLTGPRRAGKTSLLRHLFPRASYFPLEDPDVVARLRADPQGFLDAVKPPAILDEVQNVPEVFAHVRARIDRQPRRPGQWLLTGSQEVPLMREVTESMAGRAAVLSLLPAVDARDGAGDAAARRLSRGGRAARQRAAVDELISPDLSGARRPRGHGGQGPGDVPPLPGAPGTRTSASA